MRGVGAFDRQKWKIDRSKNSNSSFFLPKNNGATYWRQSEHIQLHVADK